MPEKKKNTVETKLLLGWMDEAEAMQTLLRECVLDTPFTKETAQKLWKEYQAKVAALPRRECPPPTRLNDFTQKEEYAAQHLMQKHSKTPTILEVLKLDDPSRLVAHQLSLTIPQSERYLEAMQDPKRRIRTCLGRGNREEVEIPKARREGDTLIKCVPHAEFVVTGANQNDFKVKELFQHIAVKEFDGRMLLSAGYHRSHVSMYRKSPEDAVLPLFAVLESDTVDGFFSTGSKVPFKRDMVRGSSPPLLADFFDESLCIKLPLRRCRIELRVDLKTGVWDRHWVDDE